MSNAKVAAKYENPIKIGNPLRDFLVPEDLSKDICKIKLLVFDFDGVFTDNTVYVAEDGSESVRCWRSDGLGLRKLDKLGIAYAIISTEANPVVVQRAKKLQIRCMHDCADKLVSLRALVAELGVGLEECAFVGNDINDTIVLENVRLPIVVADAHEDVVSHARLQTSKNGGFGAVREVCDLFEKVHALG
jgi:YrbI family 3-deoxy-D-manno-octulosonate 8-phosphate phosphatase